MTYKGPNNPAKQRGRIFPIPGAVGCLVYFFGLALLALLVSMFLASFNRARGPHPRSLCSSNMKTIGTAIAMYATSHRDVYPPNLEALIIAGQSPDLFICPNSGTKPLQQLMDYEGHYNFDLDGHCDYVYIAVGDAEYAQGSLATLFELPVNHGQEAVNVGHLDSHVERPHALYLLEEIQKSNDYLAERRKAVGNE